MSTSQISGVEEQHSSGRWEQLPRRVRELELKFQSGAHACPTIGKLVKRCRSKIEPGAKKQIERLFCARRQKFQGPPHTR